MSTILMPLKRASALIRGVDCAAELEVTAETYSEIVETAEFAADGQQIGESLRRVGMGPVACIYHRSTGIEGGDKRSTFHGMTHRDYVGETVDHFCGVGHGLSLAHGAVHGIGETDDVAAEFHHGRCEAETGAGRWLVEERGEFAAAAYF